MKQEPESDAALLERYALERDETAFETLVERHGPMVARVCRRVLDQEQDVEDAFQATFLVLTHKAGTNHWNGSVGGWLHAVARRLATHVRARTRSRTRRERPLTVALTGSRHPSFDPPQEIERRELRNILDDALGHLPEKYRAPMVLCYLEGKTNEEAARQLGWPAGSMSRRLQRARLLLRRRLARTALLGVLSIAAAALLLGRRAIDDRARIDAADRVRQVMRSLGTVPEAMTGRGLERLGRSGLSALDREQLAEFARMSEGAAATLADHEPVKDRATWRFESARMRLAALDLGRAVTDDDPTALQEAARQLNATCVRCHQVVRR